MMETQLYLRNVATLEYDPEKCTGCGLCIDVCPHAVFKMVGKRASVTDPDRCMECGACELNCADGAISVRSGVGCASAVITGFLNKSEPTCGCSPDTKSCC